MRPPFYPLNRASISLMILFLLSALTFQSQGQTIRYVKPADGRTIKNGLSWATAYDQNQLQQAINEADGLSGPDKQVWVAQGTYKPGGDANTARTVSFGMRDNVAIYGGFAATGSPAMSSRNPASFTTILSGEINNPNDTGDNAYAVVYTGAYFYDNNKAVGQTAILDGFTVTGGNSEGSYTEFKTYGGGGMLIVNSSPTVRNCRFTANSASENTIDLGAEAGLGGGMLNDGSSPTLINCRFDHNKATSGGGMACVFYPVSTGPSNPVLINCSFENNSASSGGGLSNYSDPSYGIPGNNLVLINCRFTDNRAVGGGAILSSATKSQVTLTNCSLVRNSASLGGGVIAHEHLGSFPNEKSIVQLTNCSLLDNGSSSAGYGQEIFNYMDRSQNQTNPAGRPITRLTNCVLWGTQRGNFVDNWYEGNHDKKFTIVSHSLLRPGIDNYTDEGNNIISDVFPFLSTTDFRLSACSPAINAGLNSATGLSGITTDLADNPRFFNNGQIDLGAYEFQGTPTQAVAITRQPVSGSSVTAGATVMAMVSVTGSSPTYQWYKNGASLGTAQQSATLTLTNVQLSDAGSYSVVVTGSCNSVTSTAFSLSVNAPSQPIRYVRQGGTGDGTSWANASGDLQSQINIAGAEQVWVAQGTYNPGTDRSISFSLKNGVSILGDFPPTGAPTLTDRNPASYTTILSGDIGQVGDITDNSYQVIANTNSDLNGTAVLDGFVITGGNANSGGGGVRIQNGSPRLLNCTITGNQAYEGGGLYTSLSSLTLVNCSISGNTAQNGGGIYTSRGTVVLINSLLSTNTATGDGGALFTNNDGHINLLNATISGNSAVRGGAILNQLSNPSLTNCIVFNNGGANTFATGIVSSNHAITTRYCLIESGATGYTSGPGTLTATRSPFVSPTTFQLEAGSVALNAGSTTAYQTASGPATDLGGLPRILGGSIDLGAYELPSDLVPLLYTRPTTVFGAQPIRVVVDVVELNGVASSGPITLRISKDARLSLSLDGSLTTVGSRPVQNSVWSLTGPSAGFYTLSSTAVIAGGGTLSVGLTGMLDPGATRGSLSISSVIVGGSGGEVRSSNNSDADKIEYFPR